MDEWVKKKLTDWGLRKYVEAFDCYNIVIALL